VRTVRRITIDAVSFAVTWLVLLTLWLIVAAATAEAQTVVRNGSAVINGETATCYTITTNPSKTTCAPLDYWATVASAQPSDICGRETRTATGYVRVQCLDYPALRRATGATMFPDEKGQQVWTRSSDPTVRAFRIALTYRKDGHLDTLVKYSDVHETYESGAGWVLGEVEIVAVEVTELREAVKTAVQ
jgi:hypothetical protein